jgi:hypothetical protein
MKSKPSPFRHFLLSVLGILVLLALLIQLQPALLRALGAVDGTFGLRPISHKCAGITLTDDWVAGALSFTDWWGKFGLFSIRYFVPRDASGRNFCLGQDVWFGE